MVQGPQPAPGSTGRRPELLRRVLLGWVTALIVARPLVLGEDWGLVQQLYGASGLVLTLLWLVAAVGWAVWRAWSGQATWSGSAVEAGLLAVVVMLFASAAGAAGYKHPAWIIASEWLALLVAFCLVRQLAVAPGDSHRLLAVVLATGVSVSAYTIYRYAVERPPPGVNRDEAQLRLAQEGVDLQQDDPRLELQAQRLRDDAPIGSFASPGTLAGYLALLLPAAVGWAVVAWRRQAGSRPAGLAAGCAVLIAVALGLTQSWPAIVACVLVGAVVPLCCWRRVLGGHKGWVFAGLAALGGTAYLTYSLGWANGAVDQVWDWWKSLRDYWTATWAMIADHPWLGVGPGNFSRLYPRYMLPVAGKVMGPHNFALEAWATGGVFALAALGAALATFFWRTRPAWTSGDAVAAQADTTSAAPWEFYLGGMAGFVLGLVLWAANQPPEHPDRFIVGGAWSVGRSILWFAVFALLEGIPWPGRSRALAVTAGVAALVLDLAVSDGINFPSVAQPLWVMAALALNVLPPRSPARVSRRWPEVMLALPLLTAVGLGYMLFVFYPVFSCSDGLRAARNRYPFYQVKIRKMEKEGTTQSEQDAHRELRNRILAPLQKAMEADPSDVYPKMLFAHWYQEQLARFYVAAHTDQNMDRLIARMQALDPEGVDGYGVEYRLHTLFAGKDPVDPQKQYQLAAAALRQMMDHDPGSALLRFHLAETLFKAGEPQAARLQARQARTLDELAAPPPRRLTDPQRLQIRRWLNAGNPR
ncbi:MAG TPA: O-antigen ligase family protein [Gemmataceae bacterium]|nr:O-antigen ligase family protein [Gemmataceae bacterium]